MKQNIITLVLIGIACAHQIHEDEQEMQDYLKKKEQYELNQLNAQKQGSIVGTIQSYYNAHGLEIICTFVTILYILNYLWGRYMNRKIADQWLDQVKQVLVDNFARIGQSSIIRDVNDVQYEEYESNEFSVQASGRQNIHYALFNLVLRKRQELFTFFFTTFFRMIWKDRDLIWVEIPIERAPIYSEILIIQKKDVKEQFKSQPHLEKIMLNITPSSQYWNSKESTLIIYGENQESVDELMNDRRITELLLNESDKIQAIHITDQKLYSKFDYVLKAQFSLDKKNISGWSKITKDILYFADFLSKMRLNYKIQEATLQRRAKLLKPNTKNSKKTK